MAPTFEQLVANQHAADFPFATWNEEFAPHSWFYSAGFAEVKELAGLSSANIKKQVGSLRDHVPDDWRQAFVNGDWDRAPAGGQIDDAGARKPLRFDKAALSLLALERALLAHGATLNPNWRRRTGEAEGDFLNRTLWQHVSLRPALYKVEGFSRKTLGEIIGRGTAFVDKLRAATPYIEQNVQLYNNITEGFTVTYPTAVNIANFLNAHDLGPSTVTRITRRTDGGRVSVTRTAEKGTRAVKKPSLKEFVFVIIP